MERLYGRIAYLIKRVERGETERSDLKYRRGLGTPGENRVFRPANGKTLWTYCLI